MKKIITKDNYRKFLNIDLFLLVICLFLLVSYVSYSYYYNGYSFKFINSKVGNFFSSSSDISLLINIENGTRNGKKSYKVVSSIPDMGYIFKSSNCKNNSVITYDEDNKVFSINANKKDECYAYFDLERNADLNMNIMIEKIPSSGEYIESDIIPIYGYEYSNYSCKNGSTITYDDINHTLLLTSNTLDDCQIYFNKKTSNIDALIYLNNSNTLELLDELNINNKYTINSKSRCRLNNIDVPSNINIDGINISIDAPDNSKCDVILDISND